MVDITKDYQFFVERLDKVTDAAAALEKLIYQESYLVNSLDVRVLECRAALNEPRAYIKKDLSTMTMMESTLQGSSPEEATPTDDGFLIGLLDHPLVKSGCIKVTISNASADEL